MPRKVGRLGALLLLLVLALACAGGGAQADSFNPVTLSIKVASVARLHAQLPITVTVTADPSVLDSATAPLRIRVKLASECGGTFATTPGDVLLDKQLSPQPTTGKAYKATATGSGKPTAYGQRIACAYLEEEGDNRMFANDTADPPLVSVAPVCTKDAARYDAAVKSLAAAKRQLRHAHKKANRARLKKLVAKRTKTVNADRRAARAACGPGVAL